MKKKLAVFTIVFNEKYFLPVWLKHYRETLNLRDIFILDNNTTDGSTDNLAGCTVINAPSDSSHDAKWLLRKVQAFVRKLLQSYEYVLFSEVDELVCCPGRDLVEYVINSGKKTLRCTGFEVVHQIDEEPAIDLSGRILQQRSLWYKSLRFSKPLITSVPVHWCVGFHNDRINLPLDENIILIHLHKICLELAYKRNVERLNIKPLALSCTTSNYGWQNRLEGQELIKFINTKLQPLGDDEIIPQWAKELI